MKIIEKKLKLNKNIIFPGEKLICLLNNYDSGLMNGNLVVVDYVMPIGNERYFRLEINVGEETIVTNTSMDYCFNSLKSFEDIQIYKDRLKNDKGKFVELLKNAKNTLSYDFFDFGYAISVHKSQGSQFNRVVLIEERSYYWDDSFYLRWLYTAITRAKYKLFVIENFNI
jgi:exodeoxyribonuclease-5